jgi:hypothetical protein
MSEITDKTIRTIRPDATEGSFSGMDGMGGDVTGGMTTQGTFGGADNGSMTDVPGDKTIVSSYQRGASSIRNGMAQPDFSDMDSDTPAAQDEYFILKGKNYKMVRCLNESSGEAQIFLVNYEGKEYVLKV